MQLQAFSGDREQDKKHQHLPASDAKAPTIHQNNESGQCKEDKVARLVDEYKRCAVFIPHARGHHGEQASKRFQANCFGKHDADNDGGQRKRDQTCQSPANAFDEGDGKSGEQAQPGGDAERQRGFVEQCAFDQSRLKMTHAKVTGRFQRHENQIDRIGFLGN